MNEKERITRMYMPFYAACGFTAAGFILFLFAFSSPYWLESYDYVHSSFLQLGIWSACFNKFILPEDYHANELTGCYWMYDRFFFQIGIWEWLNPYWLVAIQTLVIIAFICELITVMILVLYFLLYGQPAAESTIACGLQIFIGILLTTSMIIFGINSNNRKWMMRPDQMFLSWSFGFLLLSTIASFISAAFLCCISYTDRATQKEVEHYEAIEGQLGGRSLAGGGTYLSGRVGPSTLFTRSVYANQSQFGGGVVLNVPAPGNAPTQTVEIGNNNFYPGSEPFGSQLTPLQEDPLVDNEGIFSDQASGMYGHQSMSRGPYLSNNTPTHSLLYDYRRVQEQ